MCKSRARTKNPRRTPGQSKAVGVGMLEIPLVSKSHRMQDPSWQPVASIVPLRLKARHLACLPPSCNCSPSPLVRIPRFATCGKLLNKPVTCGRPLPPPRHALGSPIQKDQAWPCSSCLDSTIMPRRTSLPNPKTISRQLQAER